MIQFLVVLLVAVTLWWVVISALSFYSCRLAEPFNWRVLIWPTLYYKWLDKRNAK
jgi:hypothetical protein